MQRILGSYALRKRKSKPLLWSPRLVPDGSFPFGVASIEGSSHRGMQRIRCEAVILILRKNGFGSLEEVFNQALRNGKPLMSSNFYADSLFCRGTPTSTLPPPMEKKDTSPRRG